MVWGEVTVMSQRKEFVMLARTESRNFSELCKRFQISRKTGYKWLSRYERLGEIGLQDLSKTPKNSPNRTPRNMENLILKERRKHPAWGGRKLRVALQAQGHSLVPPPSTITHILHRHAQITPEESQKRKTFIRFEHELPNQLWQMDFKGHFPIKQKRCHPLTVLDDHSRFSLCLIACERETHDIVKNALIKTFRQYGLPDRMTMDNGSPWGDDAHNPFTRLTVWLIRIGVKVSHSRPYHPQTQGKDERFHRSLKAELLSRQHFNSFEQCQKSLDQWRDIYNLERPHEALNMKVPASRYRVSQNPFPEILPPIEYLSDDIVRKVDQSGRISFLNKDIRIGRPFIGEYVALRPAKEDGYFHVFYCHQKIKQFDFHLGDS